MSEPVTVNCLCGCVIIVDAEATMHLYPCRDDCTVIEAAQLVATQALGAVAVDCRAEEERLGRRVSNAEAQAMIEQDKGARS